MTKRVSCLEHSWKTFLSAQKVLSTLAGSPVTPVHCVSTVNSELVPIPVFSKSPTPHHGGLFNNLNDPSKFPKRDYSYKPKKSPSRGKVTLPAVEDSVPYEEESHPLICRSLSRPSTNFYKEAKQRVSSSASRDLNTSQHYQSTGELAVVLKKLALKTRTPVLQRRKSRPSTSILRSREKSLVNKGLDTTDPDTINTSPVTRSEKENKLQLSYQLESVPSTAPTSKNKRKKTLIAKYLEHMLKEQAHKRRLNRLVRPRVGSRAQLVKSGNKAVEGVRGLEAWEGFGEVLVGEKATLAKMTSGRGKESTD